VVLPIELIRVGDEPVAVRVNGREFACEDDTHNTVIPKRFLTRVRMSEIPDEITIKPVKSIEGNVIHVENDLEVSTFRDGVASVQVAETFRRKLWDGEVGLSPYLTARREAVSQNESARETDFDDNDADDYVFLSYEITVTEDLEISDAIEFVEAEIKSIHERANQLAHRRRDGLLGIFDRGSFDVDLQHALRRKEPVALVMVDIDRFKKVNDKFGHPAGDAVLRAVAKVLSNRCDGHRRVEYRYGGEELAIVATGDGATAAPELAETIRADVEGLRFEFDDLKVTVSLGVAEAGGDRDSASLVRRADDALYRAKKGGRNRVEKNLGASRATSGQPRRLRSASLLVLLVAVLSGIVWLVWNGIIDHAETATSSGPSFAGNSSLTVSDVKLAFKEQHIGTSSDPQTITVVNRTSTPKLMSLKMTGDFSETNDCGKELMVGDSCNLAVTFTPTKSGLTYGSVEISSVDPLGLTLTNPAIVTFSGSGAIAVRERQNVFKHDGSAATRLASPQPPPETARNQSNPNDIPPSLSDLFTQDFPNAMKASDDAIAIKWKDTNAILHIKRQLYLDFPGRNKFVGFYIPSSDPLDATRTAEACLKLAGVDAVHQALEEMSKKTFVAGGQGGQMDTISDLTFSGRVVIYHDDFLSITQRADIIRAYAAKHYAVQFMGPDYLANALVAWHHQHDAKDAR
jgi:diguanylate cyclase (GGDEF)-like protein